MSSPRQEQVADDRPISDVVPTLQGQRGKGVRGSRVRVKAQRCPAATNEPLWGKFALHRYLSEFRLRVSSF